MFPYIDKNALNWSCEISALSQVIAIEEQANVIKTKIFFQVGDLFVMNDFN